MEIAKRRSASVPRDLAKQLGTRGIRRLLTLLTDAYRELYDRRWVRADSPEDSITEEWFIHIQRKWASGDACGLIPIHQKADTTQAKRRGRPPTIDFCLRDAFFPESYFGAECKLLDEGCKEHLNAYLDDKEGIGRFISSKYSTCTGTGAMVGYVRRGDCVAVAKNIASAMTKMNGSPTLTKSHPLPRFRPIFESEHQRTTGVSPFLCHHLLFAFDC